MSAALPAGQLSSTTEEVAVPVEHRVAASHDMRLAVRIYARFVVTLASTAILSGAAGSVLLGSALPTIFFLSVTVVYLAAAVAVGAALFHPVTEDARATRAFLTTGRIRLQWYSSRGGRYWEVRVGDRTLHAWDEVGSQLAETRWGSLLYTRNGEIWEERDIDGNVIYSRTESRAGAYRFGNLHWFIPVWLFLVVSAVTFFAFVLSRGR